MLFVNNVVVADTKLYGLAPACVPMEVLKKRKYLGNQGNRLTAHAEISNKTSKLACGVTNDLCMVHWWMTGLLSQEGLGRILII